MFVGTWERSVGFVTMAGCCFQTLRCGCLGTRPPGSRLLSFYNFTLLINSKSANEGMHGARPEVKLDIMSNSPFVLQANTKQFGRTI